MNYLAGLGELAWEVITALLPLAAVALACERFLTPMPPTLKRQVIIGVLCAAGGIILFLQGVQIAFVPAGERIGFTLASHSRSWLIVPLGLWLGFVSALAEPAVRVMGYEVEKVSAGSIPSSVLLMTIALGVGILVAVAMARVLIGIPLMYILLPGYVLAFILTAFAPPSYASIAFDSGGVATGPVTVTFTLAVSVGAASAFQGRDPLTEGFGLVALVALAPILSVLTLGVLTRSRQGPPPSAQEPSRAAFAAQADTNEEDSRERGQL